MTRWHACGLGLALVLGAGPAAALPAGASVHGAGLSRDCWQATRDGETAARFEKLCSSALSLEQLTADDRAATLVNRGILRMRLKSYDRAIEDFNLALRYRPAFAEAFANRGAAEVGARRFVESVDDLSRALVMGVRLPEKALYNRVLAYEGLDDLPAAASDYERALHFAPGWPLLKDRLAYVTGARTDAPPKALEPLT